MNLNATIDWKFVVALGTAISADNPSNPHYKGILDDAQSVLQLFYNLSFGFDMTKKLDF